MTAIMSGTRVSKLKVCDILWLIYNIFPPGHPYIESSTVLSDIMCCIILSFGRHVKLIYV